MRLKLLEIIKKYLDVFPEETIRQERLLGYLREHDDSQIIDWNNFDGHIVAGGFIYATRERKFLVLWHKDLNMFLYPGGHMDANDENPLVAAKREVLEETGLDSLKEISANEDSLVPIDIDTHIVGYNERLNLPEHYHFEFRYLFAIERIEDIKLDTEELEKYKWIDMDELRNDPNYGKIVVKIDKILNDSFSRK